MQKSIKTSLKNVQKSTKTSPKNVQNGIIIENEGLHHEKNNRLPFREMGKR